MSNAISGNVGDVDSDNDGDTNLATVKTTDAALNTTDNKPPYMAVVWVIRVK